MSDLKKGKEETSFGDAWDKYNRELYRMYAENAKQIDTIAMVVDIHTEILKKLAEKLEYDGNYDGEDSEAEG